MVTEGEVLVEGEEKEILLKQEQFYKSTPSCKLVNQGEVTAEIISIGFKEQFQDKSILVKELLNHSISLVK